MRSDLKEGESEDCDQGAEMNESMDYTQVSFFVCGGETEASMSLHSTSRAFFFLSSVARRMA